MIAIMLGRFRMTVRDCLYEYERFADDIFGHPPPFGLRKLRMYLTKGVKYSTAGVERVFQRVERERHEEIDYRDLAPRPMFPSRKGMCQT